MIVENLPTLKINKMSQAQYNRELAAGNIDASALYLTPDESVTSIANGGTGATTRASARKNLEVAGVESGTFNLTISDGAISECNYNAYWNDESACFTVHVWGECPKGVGTMSGLPYVAINDSLQFVYYPTNKTQGTGRLVLLTGDSIKPLSSNGMNTQIIEAVTSTSLNMSGYSFDFTYAY
jgi:hypothetical protein